VLVSNRQKRLELDEASVRRLAEFVLDAEEAPAGLGVSIAFVDEAAIAEINARHLGRAEPTDVLAFPARDETEPAATEAAWPEPVEDPALLGEVVVSPEAAIAWCRTHGGEPLEEVALYVVHGVLHLLGYDDLGRPERARIRARERRLLRRAAAAGVALRGRPGHADSEPGS
jgi:probable rRNA maturation factor